MFRKLAGLTAVAGLFFAGAASAQIENSVHDFSDELASITDTCSVCHTPHSADVTVTESPLWDHDLTAVGGYSAYTSATLEGGWSAAGHSRLCLSCHDGTVAVDSYGGLSGNVFIDNPLFVGSPGRFADGAGAATDFATEHPIGSDPTADSLILDTPGDTRVLYYNGTVECSSCHDVHDQAGTTNLLVMANTDSALCLACHQK